MCVSVFVSGMSVCFDVLFVFGHVDLARASSDAEHGISACRFATHAQGVFIHYITIIQKKRIGIVMEGNDPAHYIVYKKS